MNASIIVALVTGAFTLTGVIITVVAGNRSTAQQMKEQTDLTLYRIEELEKKQEKHNSLIERMYEAEDNIKLLDERVKVANHRISDLEHKTGQMSI